MPVPAFAPVPLQASHSSCRAKCNLAGDARRRFFERKRHVVTQIRTTLPTRPATSAAPSPAAQHLIEPKKIAENILKFLEDRRVEARIESAIAQPRHSVAVVHRTLLLVRKHRVSFGSRAEIVLGLFLLFRIAVRMPLQRRLAIRRFDLFRRSAALDAQDFVKVSAVASRHRCLCLREIKIGVLQESLNSNHVTSCADNRSDRTTPRRAPQFAGAEATRTIAGRSTRSWNI